ncbi:TetR/AcrR family transcriptional regulator [Alkalibacillus almallahensis]|uniref:TetR/AcrR family transcriptional regulator n=1 Tax=Alkalibacillus almallahensis TaxID=1379154 RepID=UPI00141DB4AC|nr:TetR/AcrR family transcriptional regulator [Alkalibacillus almallahensis]NIK12612.1 AcrR family transcriptional regulator [Alkalibacillus almallahensis]
MPKKIDHTERKDHIIEAMFRIVHRSGFEKATLREIAKEADLSLGSVQHFFPKQGDIYIDAIEEIYSRFKARMDEIEHHNDENVFDNAVRMIKQIVQASTEEERMENDIWMKFSIMATMNPDYHEAKNKSREVNYSFAKEIVTMLSENGYLSKDESIDEAANTLTIFIHGLVFETVMYDELYDEDKVDGEVRRYLDGITIK